MEKIRFLLSWFIAIAALIWCASCSQKKQSPSNSVADAAFKDAPEAIQKLWTGAGTAMQSNDYTAAFLLLKNLRSQAGLSPNQSEAVDTVMADWSEKLVDLVEKGDAKAAQALEVIKASNRRSRP